MGVLKTIEDLLGQGALSTNPTHPAATPSGFGAGSVNDLAVKDKKTTASALWVQAGGPQSEARTAAAVAKAESSCNNKAGNFCCHCLWQINVKAHTQYDIKTLTSDPMECAKAAVDIFKSSGWGAWQTYTDGTYKKYLGQDCNITLKKGTVGGVVKDTVDKALSPFEAIANFFNLLTQASTWFRAGKVILGVILFVAAVWQIID